MKEKKTPISKMLSDETYDKYFDKQGKPFPIEYESSPIKPSKGSVIYTPHDCELPELNDFAVGTIWACYGYRNGRMCYDQWIIVANENGNKSWQLFQRNI